MKVNIERARHWLSVGAKPSEIVTQIFKKCGVTGDAAVTATSEPVGEGGAEAETTS